MTTTLLYCYETQIATRRIDMKLQKLIKIYYGKI